MQKAVIIACRHWKGLLALNIFVLLASITAIAITPRNWTATAQLILPTGNSGNLDVNLGTIGSFNNTDPSFSTQLNPLKLQQSILNSDALLAKVWAADPEKNQPSKPQNYGKLFTVTPLEQTNVLSISVDGSSPKVAWQRANVLLNAYQQRLNELRQSNNTTREAFSKKQLEQAEQKLTDAQIRLTNYKASTGLLNVEEQTKGFIETLGILSRSEADADAQSQASRKQAQTLSSYLNLTPAEAIQSLGLDQNEDYKFLRSKLTQIDAKIAESRSVYTDRAPDLQQLINEREELLSRLEQFVAQAAGNIKFDPTTTSGAEGRATLIQQLILSESSADGQQLQADELRSRMEELDTSLKTLPRAQAMLIKLQRQVDLTEGVYKALSAQAQQSNIDAFNAYPSVQVLDPPAVGSKPSSPKNSVIVLNALLASLLGSLALVLLLENRNPLLSAKDLQSLKFSFITRVPHLKHIDGTMGLLTGTEIESATEIEFQRLASAVSLQPLTDRRLLITSAMSNEGKTTITLQLAKALTDLGFRVLMVDGDFQRAGLSDRLKTALNFSTDSKVVQVQQNLDFIPAVPRQGKIADSVTRGRFEQYLASAQSKNDYDYILIDTAPIGSTSETALMATAVPNTLFIVRLGVSNRNAVNASLAQLAQHNSQIIGLLINSAEAQFNSRPDYSKELVGNKKA